MRKRWVNKVVSVVLAVAIFSGVLTTGLIASADSSPESRIKTSLQFAQNKSLSSISDLNTLTKDDLRAVGLFLSNFYTPYQTGFGNVEGADKVKESLAKQLKENCNMAEDTAQALVSLCWQMSLDSAQPLHLGYQEYNTSSSDTFAKYDMTDKEKVTNEKIANWYYGNMFSKLSYSTDGGVTTVETSDSREIVDALGIRFSGSEKYASNYSISCMREEPKVEGFDRKYLGSYSYTLEIKTPNISVDRKSVASESVTEAVVTAVDSASCKLEEKTNADQSSAATLYLYHYLAAGEVGGVSLASDKRVYFYWEDTSGKKHIVWDSDATMFTASSYTEALLRSQLDWGTGLAGNALFSTPSIQYFQQLFPKEDGSGGYNPTVDSDMDALNEELSKDKEGALAKKLVALSETTQQLYVDCFGNIFVDGGVNQYVVMPACTNPYSWKDSSGNAGSEVNLVNLPMMRAVADGWIDASGYTSTANDNEAGDKLGIGREATLSDKLVKMTRNSTKNAQLKADFWWWLGATKYIGDLSEMNYAAFYSIGSDSKSAKAAVFRQQFPSTFGNGGDLKTDEKYLRLESNGFITGVHAAVKMIDNLQLLESSSAVNTVPIKDMTLDCLKADAKYTSVKVDDKDPVLTNVANVNKNCTTVLLSIYLTYLYAVVGSSDLGFSFNAEGLPPITSGSTIDWSTFCTTDVMTEDIKSFIWYLLHPVKGIAYFVKWITNKLGGLLVGWHEDIVGRASESGSTGATQYIGFSGYVTLPSLHDMAWTEWLLNQYDSLVVFLIILIVIVMLCYVMLGELTLQRALAGVLIFGVCSFLPPVLIEATVNGTNMACDSLYGEKFTYWALLQDYQDSQEIQDAIDASKDGDMSEYYKAISLHTTAISNKRSNAVRLKWQSPKKDNYIKTILETVNKDLDGAFTRTDGKGLSSSLLRGLLIGSTSGEEFSESLEDTYLYRSYIDLSTYANQGYSRAVRLNGVGNDLRVTGFSSMKTASGRSLPSVISKYRDTSSSGGKIAGDTLLFGIGNGFVYGNVSDISSLDRNMRWVTPTVGNAVPKAVYNGIKSSEAKLDADYISGIPDSYFSTTIMDLPVTQSGQTSGSTKSDVTAEQYGNFVYGMYTESPFYYLSFNIQDQMKYYSQLETDGIKDVSSKNPVTMFLQPNSGYFFNTVEGMLNKYGYGELRDYMDFRSLFTVVIPYLKAANNLVEEWDNLYGLTYFEDVPLEYNEKNQIELSPSVIGKKTKKDGSRKEGYDEKLYKYWHNASVAYLLNMYTPWVDLLYSCSYAKPETISVAGKKMTISDPLDPSTYCTYDNGELKSGRPMVFSESEMKYWGLSEAQLTEVERKLVALGKTCYEKLYPLADYYNFSSESLTSVAAMLETFEFNKAFSQTSVFGQSHVLYPQSFELKNFTYDAYLRMMLSETTGESMMTESGEDMYTRIVKNSNIFVAVGYLLLDLLAVYAIPALKLFFLIGIFLMSVVLIIMAAVKIEIKISSVLWKSLIKPLSIFSAVSIGMAFVVSLFMSNGNTAVTGRGGYSISVGDPMFLIIIMLVVNIVALILYFRSLKSVGKDFAKYTKAIGQSVGGAVGGSLAKIAGGTALGMVASKAIGKVASLGGTAVRGAKRVASAPGRAVGGASRAYHNHLQNKSLRRDNALARNNRKSAKNAEKMNKTGAGLQNIQNRRDQFNSLKNDATKTRDDALSSASKDRQATIDKARDTRDKATSFAAKTRDADLKKAEAERDARIKAANEKEFTGNKSKQARARATYIRNETAAANNEFEKARAGIDERYKSTVRTAGERYMSAKSGAGADYDRASSIANSAYDSSVSRISQREASYNDSVAKQESKLTKRYRKQSKHQDKLDKRDRRLK